ncbi:MAG: phenylalanine--tRNA ligase subunit beta [Planctomycetia bacterium]
MRLSLRWLGELVDLSGLAPQQVADALTFHVAEVESVEAVGAALDAVLTARVLTCVPHPGADRLRVTTVDRGDGVVRTVVCGAPNVAAGQVVCHAPVGATLPNGMTLALRPIRGVTSDGMLCAEDEMGLGSGHDGILVLDPATPLGRPVSQVLGLSDHVLEVGNTAITHRPDLWGHAGVARELAAVLGRKATFPGTPAADAALEAARGTAGPAVAIEDEAGCRRYVGLALEGLANGPSPARLRARLEAAGVRSVDLLVDLTQLAMLETGQPLHAFDLHQLAGTVRARRARAGERLVTLDGVERALQPDDIVIADEQRVLALAGIMGGREGSVSGATTAVLLESACFEPGRIRRTSQRLGLRTDASARFEKSLDPLGCEGAARRFLQLVLEHCPQARLRGAASDVFPHPPAPLEVDLAYDRVRRRLGTRISDAEVRARLQALGFAIVETRDGVRARVPSWRATRDIRGPEDLIEEVGRTRGYGDIQPVAPVGALSPRRMPPARRAERKAASVLSLELGYAQATCYSFYAREDAERIGLAGVAHLALRNPLAADQDRLVLSTLPNLLKAAGRNLPREASGRLWESTRLVAPGAGAPEGAPPVEVPMLGLLAFERDAVEDAGGRAYLGLLQDLRTLLARFGVPRPEVVEGPARLHAALPLPSALHPGRTAHLRVGAQVVAVAGEVAPAVRRAYGLAGRQVHAEVLLAGLVACLEEGGREYRPVPRFPVAPFDVAVVVPRRTLAARVLEVVERALGEHGQGARVFDAYEGEGIPPGHRSLALTVDLLDREGTLAPAQAEGLRKAVLAALEQAGWSVRTAKS